MRKLLLASLFLSSLSAHAAGETPVAPAAITRADPGYLECVVTESMGRRREKYTLRLGAPSRKGEFPLRLYPLIVVNIDSYADQSLANAPLEINATVLDNSIEDAQLLLDLMVARAKGEGRLSLYTKLGTPRQYSVGIECTPAGATPSFFN